ncbi:MAG: YfhO family protein [Actinomycetota bacterium]|nr:YfhO family protein [Actinomycetota bacterium]
MLTQADPKPHAARLRQSLIEIAGPALIIAAVVVVLKGILFGGLLPGVNPDVLAYWLPNHCNLGRTLAAGDVPLWNPYSLGGMPFASDPQSGWMYFPAMVLYTLFPCDLAVRLFTTLLVVITGIGAYSFLRSEGMSRVAATTGGLVLAMYSAVSGVSGKFPFSGFLAFSTLTLAGASRVLQARTWGGRMGWSVATALAWGQLAAAHLSNGVVMGTVALGFYIVYRLVKETREGRATLGGSVLLVTALIAIIAVVNLAYLAPRLAYFPRSTIGEGYDGLREVASELRGKELGDGGGAQVTEATWGLRLVTAPGPYFGAVPLFLIVVAFWNRRHRGLVVTFATYSLLFYVGGLRIVVEALDTFVTKMPLGDFYLHFTGRFTHAVPLGLAVLAAVGTETWREAASIGRRVLMSVPGLLLWIGLPLLVGANPERLAFFLAAAGLGIVILTVAHFRSSLLVVVPVMLAVELTAAGFVNQNSTERQKMGTGFQKRKEWVPADGHPKLVVDVADYVKSDTLLETVARSGDSRVVTLQGRLWDVAKPMLYGASEPQGYNPVQQLDYWKFIQALEPPVARYSVRHVRFHEVTPKLAEMLQVGWVLARATDAPAGQDWSVVSSTGDGVLYRLPKVSPRASLMSDWSIVYSHDSALDIVASSSFSPRADLVIEKDPGLNPDGSGDCKSLPGEATYEAQGEGAATIDVQARCPGIVLVRNVYDENWRATVDGREVPLLRSNYFLQGVPVTRGDHRIVLEYRDPWVWYGLIVSIVSTLGLLGAAFLLRRRNVR